MIPEDIDILITHGPAWGILDDVEGNRNVHLDVSYLQNESNKSNQRFISVVTSIPGMVTTTTDTLTTLTQLC
jgi:hypothetical protein